MAICCFALGGWQGLGLSLSLWLIALNVAVARRSIWMATLLLVFSPMWSVAVVAGQVILLNGVLENNNKNWTKQKAKRHFLFFCLAWGRLRMRFGWLRKMCRTENHADVLPGYSCRNYFKREKGRPSFEELQKEKMVEKKNPDGKMLFKFSTHPLQLEVCWCSCLQQPLYKRYID